MAELTPEQRIAALKARRAQATEASADIPPTPASTAARVTPATGPVLSRSRVLVASTSAVSFATMVVAMGPIRLPAAATTVEAGDDTFDGVPLVTAGAVPDAPPVSVEGAPDQLAMSTESLPGSATSEPGADRSEAAPVTAAPTTASPLTAAPPPTTASPLTAAPATAAPTTAPPPTAAPTTAVPTTVAPTTAPPTTAAPTTAPPTSKGSG